MNLDTAYTIVRHEVSARLYTEDETLQLSETSVYPNRAFLSIEGEIPFSLELWGHHEGIEIRVQDEQLRIHPKNTSVHPIFPWNIDFDSYTDHGEFNLVIYADSERGGDIWLSTGYPALTGQNMDIAHPSSGSVYRQLGRQFRSDSVLDTMGPDEEDTEAYYLLYNVENGAVGTMTPDEITSLAENGSLIDLLLVEQS